MPYPMKLRLDRNAQLRANERASERGMVMIVYTISMALIVLVLGLAIDGGVLYLIKGRLQAASDAGALAAARSLNLSLTPAQQDADAATAANNFFNANFPDNLFKTTSSQMSTGVSYGSGAAVNTVYVTTTATTNAPTYFMRWLGYTTVPLRVTGTASRRDLNLMLVLDRSGSMNNGATPSACDQMKTAADSFVDMFSNNRDMLGLVVFNSASQTLFSPVKNFNPGIKAQIDAITCGGWTGTAGGLHEAYRQILNLNNPAKLNAIVVFTDGLANTIQSSFPVKSMSDNRWGTGTNASTLVPVGPSGCSSSPTPIGSLSGEGTVNGDTQGLHLDNDLTEPVVFASGCAYPGDTTLIRNDAAYIPNIDRWGNLTTGYRTNYVTATRTFSAGQDTFPSGPYFGFLRPDQPQTIANAAYNAVEDQGRRIRNNTTFNPMILAIGLGGNSITPVDAEMLIRLANVPNGFDPLLNPITNSIFDPTQAEGVYVYSPTSSDLLTAFSKVGSFLVELSK